MVCVCLFHDLVRNAMGAAIGNRFLLRHDPVIVCIALLKVSGTGWITPDPFLLRHFSVMVCIPGIKGLVYQVIARFVTRKFSVVISVRLIELIVASRARLT